jgi:hypothetical protein
MKPHEQYPSITKACLEIAFCNGGVNRDRGEPQVIAEINAWLDDRRKGVVMPCTDDSLAAIDAWLAELVDEDLSTLCDGEEAEQAAILMDAPFGTADLLEAYFNDVC